MKNLLLAFAVLLSGCSTHYHVKYTDYYLNVQDVLPGSDIGLCKGAEYTSVDAIVFGHPLDHSISPYGMGKAILIDDLPVTAYGITITQAGFKNLENKSDSAWCIVRMADE